MEYYSLIQIWELKTDKEVKIVDVNKPINDGELKIVTYSSKPPVKSDTDSEKKLKEQAELNKKEALRKLEEEQKRKDAIAEANRLHEFKLH